MRRTKGDGTTDGKNGNGRQKGAHQLKLLRVEPSGRKALNLIFEGEGVERTWRLENTSINEVLALILQGRMHGGRRVFLAHAELTFEPPDDSEDDPKLCMAMGPLELCAPMARADVKALKTDIDRSLKRA